MYCLDTNILIDLFRGDKEIISKINEIDNKDIFITPITLCELFKGVHLSSKKEEEIEEIRNLTNFFEVLDFDIEVCEEFGEIFSELRSSGRMIPDFDIIIASFVNANNLILITRDRHFENLGAKVEIW
jgi:tRNA(fMet)-specific endonuclease VapC